MLDQKNPRRIWGDQKGAWAWASSILTCLLLCLNWNTLQISHKCIGMLCENKNNTFVTAEIVYLLMNLSPFRTLVVDQFVHKPRWGDQNKFLDPGSLPSSLKSSWKSWTKVLGGGKMIHSPIEKSVKVFSKSTGQKSQFFNPNHMWKSNIRPLEQI